MAVFSLTVKEEFSAAHRLEEYGGKCEELHGHNYGVEIVVKGAELNRDGMLIDFAVLKGHLRAVLTTLDHKYLNEIDFFRERASSSEYVALYLFRELKERIGNEGAALREVRVWESGGACAAYSE
jgi:6-pyruvoyltetrahydropterin/6-carboxytetrahydropterin synthase